MLTSIDQGIASATITRYIEKIDNANVKHFLESIGYKDNTAEAISMGALIKRESTIILARQINLII